MLKKVVFKPTKELLMALRHLKEKQAYINANADALHRRCALTGLGRPLAWTPEGGYYYQSKK